MNKIEMEVKKLQSCIKMISNKNWYCDKNIKEDYKGKARLTLKTIESLINES